MEPQFLKEKMQEFLDRAWFLVEVEEKVLGRPLTPHERLERSSVASADMFWAEVSKRREPDLDFMSTVMISVHIFVGEEDVTWEEVKESATKAFVARQMKQHRLDAKRKLGPRGRRR